MATTTKRFIFIVNKTFIYSVANSKKKGLYLNKNRKLSSLFERAYSET
jgi:hypothetical protein